MIRTVCTEPGTIPYTGVNLKYPDFPSTDDTTGNPVYGLFRLSADPNTGSISNPFENDFYSPVIIEDLSIANSALAMNSSGYLYYFKYNPDYSISIGSIKSSPIIDLTDNAIRYPNLLAPGNTVEGAAIDVNGMGWAILADKSFITFQTTLSGGVSSIPNINGNIVPDDGLTSYRIEDIAFDASNNMYLLVREFNNFTTNIYYIPSGDIQQAGAGTTLTMKKLWTIQIPNLNPDNESAAIKGLALSSSGKFYVSYTKLIVLPNFELNSENSIAILTPSATDPGTMLLQTNFMYHNQFLPGIVETGNFSGCTPHTTITDLATAVTPIVLPVTFGSITAVLNGKTLKVSFTTLTETNNDYYNIEVSNDGKLFKTATRLQSQAINGNSTVPLHYNISLDYNTINYLGWPLFFLVPLIGVIGIVRKRKPLLLISGLTGILFIFLVGCQKSGDETVNQNSADKIFVRIAQVDKDGTTVYSKIVKAVEGE